MTLSGAGLAESIGLANNTTIQKRLSEDLKVMLGAGFTTIQGQYKNTQNSWSKLNLWDTTAIVKMGILEIEGLRFDDNGEFAVAVPQICSIFQFATNQASRDLKAILGAGFQFDMARTTLNPKAVNCVTLLK